MNRRYYTLILIVLLVGLGLWIDLSDTFKIVNPFTQSTIYTRDVSTRLGLDLRGGLQVLLEADLPEDQVVDAEQMSVARDILENRTNALGVSESSLQVAGDRRIVGEFPGISNPDEVMGTLGQTGLLEFVDFSTLTTEEIAQLAQPDVQIKTDFGLATPVEAPDATLPVTERVYHTIMTGTALRTAAIGRSEVGEFFVDFELNSDGAKIFKEFTGTHINKVLAIVLDKKIVSAPEIQSQIEDRGQISGTFTYEEANSLVIQLRYGSLPIPFKVAESRVVGPTLGQDSLTKSLFAGLVGMLVVFLFMGIYYRLPGVLADISIIVYGILAFALFKWIPVTLTLSGVAGFLLSTGSALDANILIFERFKEELRAGRRLEAAATIGWSRAWPSIRDSNIATLITSLILFVFGNAFGATVIKGFAFTLFIGVAISLFTSLVVTRTLLNLVIGMIKPGTEKASWFGI